MSEQKDLIKKFIATCMVTFKAFEYNCEVVKASATIWNFVATGTNGDKKYAVYCAPRLDKARSLIKIAKKKLKDDMRLVVVTQSHSEEELDASREDGYALVTLDILNKYGDEMIDIRTNQADTSAEPVQSEVDALSSSREKVF